MTVASSSPDLSWADARRIGRSIGIHTRSSPALPGVFVAGDVRHGSIKRVASAVGEGAMAVNLIHQHLAATY